MHLSCLQEPNKVFLGDTGLALLPQAPSRCRCRSTLCRVPGTVDWEGQAAGLQEIQKPGIAGTDLRTQVRWETAGFLRSLSSEFSLLSSQVPVSILQMMKTLRLLRETVNKVQAAQGGEKAAGSAVESN